MSGTQTSEQMPAHEHSDGTSTMKSESEPVERLGQTKTHATYIEREEVAMLSAEHRSYLLRRHGTLELDPVPGHGDADPYNWPTWKVVYLFSSGSSNFLLIHCIRATESHESYSCRHTRLYGHLYSRIHSIGIHRNCCGSRRKPSTSHIPHISPNCYPWRRPFVLETRSEPLWAPTCLPSFTHLQCCRQHRLRQKPLLRFNGRLQGDCRLLHQPCCCYW